MTTLEATPTPVRTLDPLRAAVRYIDAHQERWNQAAWGIVDISSEARAALPQGVNLSLADLPIGVAGGTPADLSEPQACGTAYCVAGFVCHQAGWDEIWDLGTDGELRMWGVARPDGVGSYGLSPGSAAVDILGLKSNHEANQILSRMFESDNNRADIQAYAEDLGELVGDLWDVPVPDWAADQTPGSHNLYNDVSCDCGCDDDDDGYYEDEED